MVAGVHFILYVADQRRSADFYRRVLGVAPILDVPGMTEFPLNGDSVLGIMPEEGIRRLLGDRLPDPAAAAGVPRAELYVQVDDCTAYHARGLAAGGRELSSVQMRDWGDIAGYFLDPDGHVVAFAQASSG